jgi:predicted kinase
VTHVIILSGISGSGKYTLAQKLADEEVAAGGKAQICCADDYFMDSAGNYNFDANKLGDVHALCYSKFLKALADGVNLIVVSNTNTRIEDCSPYFLGAAAYGVKAKLITLDCDPSVAAGRNVHGLDERAVRRQEGSLERRYVPKYWEHEIRNAES